MKKLKVLLLTAGLIGALSIAGGCGSKTPSGDDVDDLGMSKEEMDEMREEMADENDDVKSEEDAPKTKTETITLTLSDGHTITFDVVGVTSITQDGKTATIMYENDDDCCEITYSETNLKTHKPNSGEDYTDVYNYYLERGIDRASIFNPLSSYSSNNGQQVIFVGEYKQEEYENAIYFLDDVGGENYLEIKIIDINGKLYDDSEVIKKFELNKDGHLD